MNEIFFYTQFMWKEQTSFPWTPPPSVLPSTHRERVSTGLENARWFCNLTCLSFSLSLSFCLLGRCQFLGLLISSMKLWEQQAPLAWMPSKACAVFPVWKACGAMLEVGCYVKLFPYREFHKRRYLIPLHGSVPGIHMQNYVEYIKPHYADI